VFRILPGACSLQPEAFSMLYFIAIVAPDEINQQVLEWKNYMLQRFNCKVALKSPAHITLVPPFDMPDTAEQTLQELLQPFAARQQSFPIHLKNFAAFKPRVIYVDVQPSEPLNDLKINLETCLQQANHFPIKKEERSYHPHVTIANRDLKNDNFPEAWQHFQPVSDEVAFQANALSLLRHKNHVWEIAGTFPLSK
jgi:2'-5' RNA ligase